MGAEEPPRSGEDHSADNTEPIVGATPSSQWDSPSSSSQSGNSAIEPLAWLALWLSIGGLLFCFCPFPLSIAALIVAARAKKYVTDSAKPREGKQLIKAAQIMSVVGLVIWTVVFAVAVIAGQLNHSDKSQSETATTEKRTHHSKATTTTAETTTSTTTITSVVTTTTVRSPGAGGLTAADEPGILAMLQSYTSLYNSGDYIQASGDLSLSTESGCGGATNLAFALSQNHSIDTTNISVLSVKAWGDGSNKADVSTIETWHGTDNPLSFGQGFVFENGGWKLADMYPYGANAFCNR